MFSGFSPDRAAHVVPGQSETPPWDGRSHLFLGSLNKSVGGHSDEFCAFKPKHALFFVIPAKAGIQIRDDPVDCVSPRFSPCFSAHPPLDPRFRGDDGEGQKSGVLGRGETQTAKPQPSGSRKGARSQRTAPAPIGRLAIPGGHLLGARFYAIPLSVIPAKAGIQVRNNPVDCVSPGFFPCFPVRPPLDPRFRGDDEGGRVRRFESQDWETIDLLHVYLQIEPFTDFCKRFGLRKFFRAIAP